MNSSGSFLRIHNVLLKIQAPLLQVILQVFCKLIYAKKTQGYFVKKLFRWLMIRNLLQHFTESKIFLNDSAFPMKEHWSALGLSRYPLCYEETLYSK